MNQNIVLDNKMGFRTADVAIQDPPELEIIQLRVLLEVSRSLNSTLDLNRLLEIIVEVAAALTDSEAASILLLDEVTGELRFEAATGVKKAEVRSITVPLEGSIAGWIIFNNQPQITSNAHNDPRHFSTVDNKTRFNTQSILGVPLRTKDKTIGAVEVLNKKNGREFTQHDLGILETLAAQAAITIENARLYNNLQAQVQTLQEVQARLLRSEKLAVIGELVAGAAQELNNPLTSIIGFAELLKLKDMDHESRQDLDRITTQGHRAAGIVRSLLNCTEPHCVVQKPVQVNDLLKNTIADFAQELRAYNITLQTHFQPNLPLTIGDPHQLQQAFGHLICNSYQAMSKEQGCGQLTIVTEVGSSLFHSHPGKNLASEAEAYSVIRITIHDDGPGIPPNYMSRIFSPFFTTKGPEEGIGLGLSICNSIVSEHGGHIWAESTQEQGTSFFIELPINTSDPRYSNNCITGSA